MLFGNDWTKKFPNFTTVCRCDETSTIHLAYHIIIYYIYKYIASTPDGKSQVVRYGEISSIGNIVNKYKYIQCNINIVYKVYRTSLSGGVACPREITLTAC